MSTDYCGACECDHKPECRCSHTCGIGRGDTAADFEPCNPAIMRKVVDAALVWYGGRHLPATSAERGGQLLALAFAVRDFLEGGSRE